MKKEGHLLLFLSLLWALLLFILGGWWFYLMTQFGNGTLLPSAKVAHMIKWEGVSFLALLLLLSVTMMILYWRDMNKARALQTFFASLTHELKTPLASVRLQSEVIHELGNNTRLTDRLIEDTKNLEYQMDKILQLSRIELGGNLGEEQIEFEKLIKNLISKISPTLLIQITSNQLSGEEIFSVDRFALELILNNLIENSKRYNPNGKIEISLSKDDQYLNLKYTDGGNFKGDLKKACKLFYKHTNTSGSGIGLYLINKLMQKMRGEVELLATPFVVNLYFPVQKKAI